MDVDDYDATVVISAQDTENSPRHIEVNLEVEVLSEEPVIDFNNSSFSFAALTGGDAPLDQVLKIWNKGEGTLEWSVSSSADWLTLKPKSGKSEGEKDKVAVSVNPDGMETGDYDAEIVIKGDGADNSPQRTMVNLRISTELNYCKLLTTVSPLDAGSVGVDFPQPVEGYPQGTELRLVAVPASGSVFSYWTGDIDNDSNPVDIMLSSDTEVVAHFVPFDNSQMPDTTLLTASSGITAGFDRATKMAIIIIAALVLTIVFIIFKSRGESY